MHFLEMFHDGYVTLACMANRLPTAGRHFGVQARQMKIHNPSRPPFNRGGRGVWGVER